MYDNRRFRPVDAVPGSSVGHYHQDGDLVWAEFSGTAVRAGRVVATCGPDGVLDAAYCYVTAAGDTVSGTFVGTPTLLDDGRIRLTEAWSRTDGSSGVSEIEEFGT